MSQPGYLIPRHLQFAIRDRDVGLLPAVKESPKLSRVVKCVAVAAFCVGGFVCLFHESPPGRWLLAFICLRPYSGFLDGTTTALLNPEQIISDGSIPVGTGPIDEDSKQDEVSVDACVARTLRPLTLHARL